MELVKLGTSIQEWVAEAAFFLVPLTGQFSLSSFFHKVKEVALLYLKSNPFGAVDKCTGFVLFFYYYMLCLQV
jgi:hypothetical protein